MSGWLVSHDLDDDALAGLRYGKLAALGRFYGPRSVRPSGIGDLQRLYETIDRVAAEGIVRHVHYHSTIGYMSGDIRRGVDPIIASTVGGRDNRQRSGHSNGSGGFGRLAQPHGALAFGYEARQPTYTPRVQPNHERKPVVR